MTVFSTGRGAEDPTPVEAKVLDFVVAFHDQHSRFPTHREVRIEFTNRSLTVSRERSLTRIESALRRSSTIGRTASW
jgi:hypothetical protein